MKKPKRKPLAQTEQTLASRLWKFLGSPKLTLVIAALTLASILYFKNNTNKNKTKPTTKETPNTIVPLFAPQNVLGRSRPLGPLLTPSFFRSGDLIIRKNKEILEWGLIQRLGKQIFVHPPKQNKQSVLPWLKTTGGRFALLRLNPKKGVPLSKPTTKPPSTFAQLRLLYQHSNIQLPPPHTQKGAQKKLKELASQSHYNDLDPRIK